MFKTKSNAPFNNNLFSRNRICRMHPSAQRLYDAAKSLKGVTGQSAVARLLNESPQTLRNWEMRGISNAGGIKAQQVVGCDVGWLTSGEGEMQAAADVRHTAEATPRFQPAFTVEPESVLVPVLAQSVSMGPGSEQAHDDVVVGRLTLSPSWINKTITPLTSPKNLRFIHGYGDSMEPTFVDGDVLLVDGGVKDVKVDGIYVIEAQGRLFVKRVRQRLDGAFEISSDNPTVKTIDVLDGRHEVNVLGRVVWLWNGRKM